MKKHTKLLTIILILAMVFSFAACGGSDDEAAEEPATALWSDEYVAMMESGEQRDYVNYDSLLQPLKDYQSETGSKYIYCVAPVDPDNLDGDYELTIDASEVPDDWGTNYGFEIQFKEAAEGEVAAARSAWEDNDEGTEWCWSAFAPVKDEDGTVVAIVGIDYPAPIIADYPEWDRDSDEWNGEEGAWPDDMPKPLQTFVDECKDRVATLAEQLSTEQIEVQS